MNKWDLGHQFNNGFEQLEEEAWLKSEEKNKSNKCSIWKKVMITIMALVGVLVVEIGIVVAKLYSDVFKSAKATYASVERTATSADRDSEVDLSKKEPFSVLLLGVDTGAMGRTYKDRSDSMMVATVNPNDNKSNIRMKK